MHLMYYETEVFNTGKLFTRIHCAPRVCTVFPITRSWTGQISNSSRDDSVIEAMTFFDKTLLRMLDSVDLGTGRLVSTTPLEYIVDQRSGSLAITTEAWKQVHIETGQLNLQDWTMADKVAGLEIAGLEMTDRNLADWKMTDCKLANWLDIGCDTYTKLCLKSMTTICRATL